MSLGTPLTATATRVLLLGSGELGKEVAISLQRLGVEVIAVDRYPNAPAMQLAHRSHVLDMTDPDALKALIAEERPHFVVPEIEAIATSALLSIEAEGLAEVIPTARAVQLTMNREGIRTLAAVDLGLPTSRYAFASSREELLAAVESHDIGYPCFIKPVMSSSGKGQSIARNEAELAAAWDYARVAGRVDSGRVIVEARVEFDFEITLLTIRSLGADLQTHTSFAAPIGHRQERGDYVESWQPQAMSPVALERAQHIAREVTDALGGRGVFGVELFVRGNEVWFSEVSPRPHDTGLVTLITQWQSEFELHARAILGLPTNPELRTPGASAVIYGGKESEALVYAGLERALLTPHSEVRLFGKPVSYPRRRMGVAVVAAEDVDTARARARDTAQAVQPA